MGQQNHIIRKLIIEVGVPTKEEAFSIQNRISEQFKAKIFRLIEELLDRMVREHEVIRIEKLEVEIPRMPVTRLEAELAPAVMKETEEVLIKILHEIRNNPGGSSSVTVSTESGKTFSVHASISTAVMSDVEKLSHLLQFGFLPWSADKESEKVPLRELVARLMEEQPEQLVVLLRKMAMHPNAFKRLAMQLPEVQFIYLIAIAGCSFSSELEVLLKNIYRVFEINASLRKNSGLTLESYSSLKHTVLEETLFFFASQNVNRGTEAVTVVNNVREKFIQHILHFISKKTQIILSLPLPVKVQKEVPVDILKAVKVIAEILPATSEIKTKQPEIASCEPEEGIYVSNAGLVIVAPYLPGFFKHIGYTTGKEFADDDKKHRAVHLLQWMVYGDNANEVSEHDLVLNKILCGVELSEPVPEKIRLTKKEKKECLFLLESVISNWTIIKNTSVDGFRNTFLVKNGKLKTEGNDWELFIERDSGVDVLIDRLPWSISLIKLPWNKKTIYTQW